MRTILTITAALFGLLLPTTQTRSEIFRTTESRCEDVYRALLPVPPSDAIWATRETAWLGAERIAEIIQEFDSNAVNPWEHERNELNRVYGMNGLPIGRIISRWGFVPERQVETWKTLIVLNLPMYECRRAFGETLVIIFDYEHPDKKPSERYPLGTYVREASEASPSG